MLPDTRDWLDGLRDSVARRRHTPEMPRGDSPAATAERAILAAHLATWLARTPDLLAARRALAAAGNADIDPDPAVVLTTSPLGLEVADEILGADTPLARDLRPRVACATERGYRDWCMRHPDDAHRRHVNHWSWLKTRVPPQRDAEFARHPLRPGDAYWLHRVGTAGAGDADGRESHLWRFDGHRAELLEAFVVEFEVPPPGP